MSKGKLIKVTNSVK